MKKVLLLTIAVLALGATLAVADSMNMGYACRVSTNNASVATNDFNTGGAGVCDDGVSYTATKGLVCSFKNTATMLGWGGTHVMVDIQTTAPMPDFWNVGTGGCRNGSLSCPNVIVAAGANCTNMFTVAPADGQTDNNFINVFPATGRINVSAYHVRNTTQVDLPPPTSSGGYLSENVRIDANGADVCAGCEAPACMVLNATEYYSLQDNAQIFNPELRNWVTWNGGGANCPGSTPTQNSTWGKVKALYR